MSLHVPPSPLITNRNNTPPPALSATFELNTTATQRLIIHLEHPALIDYGHRTSLASFSHFPLSPAYLGPWPFRSTCASFLCGIRVVLVFVDFRHLALLLLFLCLLTYQCMNRDELKIELINGMKKGAEKNNHNSKMVFNHMS